MYIKSYEYVTATKDCKDHLEIEGVNREDYAVRQYIEKMSSIVLTENTAVLYSAGATTHQSETRESHNLNARYVGTVPKNKSSMVIKELSTYNLHQWIGSMENNELVTYANINGNTCASSMHSIYEAEQLLNSGAVDEVVVITEERTSFNTIRIFKEHSIPLIVSDGVAIVVFSRDRTNLEVTDTKWSYQYNRNPFGTSADAYAKVDTDSVNIKPHGTRTNNNDTAEVDLIADRNSLYYKDEIGHAQGASALIELCMVIDDDTVTDTTLCVASGLGGFYGSCILHKAR